MEKRISRLLLLVMIVFGNLTLTSVSFSVRVPICPTSSANDYIFGFQDQTCPVSCVVGDELDELPPIVAVTEGNERVLQIALDMIEKNKSDFVALLFYASWCPFSMSFRPNFDLVSSLYSSIPHFAVMESSVKPSTLSKHGVHGFPTLLLLNSTNRARYHGTRALDSLIAFYADVTGIETLDKTLIEKSVYVPSHLGNENNTEPENCPFTWARSPENMLHQETYLALAVAFVLLRLLHFVFPTLVVFAKFTWGRIAQSIILESLLDHTVGFLSRAVQICTRLKEPCKRRGAMNARAWASKSLATVSIGDSSSSNRGFSASH